MQFQRVPGGVIGTIAAMPNGLKRLGRKATAE